MQVETREVVAILEEMKPSIHWLRWLSVLCVVASIVPLTAVDAIAGAGIWTTNGPEGGSVSSIAVDPNNSAILYVGTRGASRGGGGIFKSTNSSSWTPVNTGLTFMEVNAIVATRLFTLGPTVVYAGTLYGGIYRSTNGGATWVQVITGLTNLNVNALAVDPTNSGTVYAGTDGGVFVTKNGSATWTAVNTGLTSMVIWSLATHPSVPNVVFAGTDLGGLFATANGGATWLPLNCGLTGLSVYAIEVARNFPWPLYLATSGGVFWRSLFLPCWTRFTALPAQTFRALASDPNSPHTLYAASFSGTVYRTTNGGSTWGVVGTPLLFVNVLAVDPLTGVPYAGTDGFGFNRNNGASWIAQNSGLTAHPSSAIAVAPSNPDVIYVGTLDNGVHKSVNGGLSWTSVLSWTGIFSVAVDPTDPDIVYLGHNPSGFYKSTNGGVSWSQMNSGLSASVYSEIYAIAIDPASPSTIYIGTFLGVFKSTNGGMNWSSATGGGLAGFWIHTIVIDPLVPTTVYAGGVGIVKSTNGGASWTSIVNGLTFTAVASLAIRPDHPNILYAGTGGGGIFLSDTAGLSWSPVSSGLTNPAVLALAIDPVHPDTIYAGTVGGGVWRSTNTGATWSAFNAGSPNPFINALGISPSGTFLHAATGGSVYDIDVSVQPPPPPQ